MRKRSISLLILAVLAIFAVLSGTVFAETAADFNLYASQTENFVGDSFTVTISGQNVTEMAAYEMTLKFDTDKLSFGVDKTQSLTADTYSISPVVNGNEITLRAAKKAGAVLDTGNFDLCRLTFKRIAEGDASVTLGNVQALNANLAATDYVINKSVTVKLAVETPPTPPDNNNGSGSSEGSSNSSSGGSAAPTTTAAISTPSSISNGGSVKLMAQKGRNGSVSATVGRDEMKKAVESAEKGFVNIYIESAEAAGEVQVNLPGAECLAAGQNNISVKLLTQLGNASISPEGLQKIITTTSNNVQLCISKIDGAALAKDAARVVGSNPVYVLSISVDGRKVTDLGKKALEVAVSYMPKQGEITGKIVLYSIPDDGTLKIIKNGRYNQGKVVFSPDQLGKYAAAYADVNFSDLSKVKWAEESIEALAARGAIDGIGAGAFGPDGEVTRAQFIKILMSTFDLVDTSSISTFKDVKKGEWYYGAVASAEKLGIIKGDGKGSFGIEEKITRQDMAVMVYRLGRILGPDLAASGNAAAFKDQSGIASYASEAVSSMQTSGIIKGMNDGRFAPSENTSRAEAAVVIYRLFNITG